MPCDRFNQRIWSALVVDAVVVDFDRQALDSALAVA
jgi:hypothetical protein